MEYIISVTLFEVISSNKMSIFSRLRGEPLKTENKLKTKTIGNRSVWDHRIKKVLKDLLMSTKSKIKKSLIFDKDSLSKTLSVKKVIRMIKMMINVTTIIMLHVIKSSRETKLHHRTNNNTKQWFLTQFQALIIKLPVLVTLSINLKEGHAKWPLNLYSIIKLLKLIIETDRPLLFQYLRVR